MNDKASGRIGTFSPNHTEPIHGWYPYIEGYSSALVEAEFEKLLSSNIEAVYDPFGGTGTTPLVSCMHGLKSFYSETNPFMRQVAETKTTVASRVSKRSDLEDCLQGLLSRFEDNSGFESIAPEWNGFEKYFEPQQLSKILYIRSIIDQIDDNDLQAISMLALSAVIVPASKMIRRGDLRFAKDQELAKKPQNVSADFLRKLREISVDILHSAPKITGIAHCVAPDARDLEISDAVDLVVTSPPYLNGTNYIRNTKLELKLNRYVESESELAALHSKGVVAGINNVSKKTREASPVDVAGLDAILERLSENAYDKRIPIMVSCYFRDMDSVFDRLAMILRRGGVLVMDIGDSQFAGIHIPTHELLIAISENHGFALYEDEVLRSRRSKNGMELSQRILRFRLER